MILTHNKIIDAVRSGVIKIEPFEENNIGAASIDFHLGNEFRRIVSIGRPILIDEEKNDDAQYSNLITLCEGETITINPGETILGITKEKLTNQGILNS